MVTGVPMVHRRLHSYSLVVVALLGGKTALAADPAAAEALFQKGVAEMDAGRLDRACPALAESQRLDPRPGTLCALAECEEKAGRIATATSLYTDYLRQYEAMSVAQKNKHAERAKQARAQKDALAAEVPALTLVLRAGAPAQTRILRDGVEITAASLDMPLPVDPGEHVIATQAPGGPLHEERVRLSRGEQKTVELSVEPARVVERPRPVAPKRAEVQPPAPVKESGAWMRPAAYASLGIGIAGAVVGASTGGMVLGMSSEIQKECTPKCATPEAAERAERAHSLAWASNIGIGVAVAGVATSAVLFVLSSKKSAAPTSSNKSGALTGSVEVGPGGAAVFAKGGF